MHLTQSSVFSDYSLEKQVKALYLTAFPKYERLPWWLLKLNARRKGIVLTAYMDGNTFCGFTASVRLPEMHFILFLAVAEARRGTGCGSAILSSIKEDCPNVTLNIELLNPAAENYPERLKRFAFYQKNGFSDTQYHVWEVGGKFRVLSTQVPLDVAAYKKVFRKLSLGLWDVRLEKVKDVY